ncbi:hypothetical protein ABGV42_01345 [Paenibacillus pabuli]|uniref:hypothetical protein n=1 Tax=Paenibacillus pabuli TaxID=1472 RepID=UPI003242F5BB
METELFYSRHVEGVENLFSYIMEGLTNDYNNHIYYSGLMGLNFSKTTENVTIIDNTAILDEFGYSSEVVAVIKLNMTTDVNIDVGFKGQFFRVRLRAVVTQDDVVFCIDDLEIPVTMREEGIATYIFEQLGIYIAEHKTVVTIQLVDGSPNYNETQGIVTHLAIKHGMVPSSETLENLELVTQI